MKTWKFIYFHLGNYKYILCVIDNFSKMAFLRALINKSSQSVTNGLEDIFIKTNRIPKKIHHDGGGYYYFYIYNLS